MPSAIRITSAGTSLVSRKSTKASAPISRPAIELWVSKRTISRCFGQQTELLLLLASIDYDWPHAHGSCKLYALYPNTSASAWKHYPVRRLQLCFDQSPVHSRCRAHDWARDLVRDAVRYPRGVYRRLYQVLLVGTWSVKACLEGLIAIILACKAVSAEALDCMYAGPIQKRVYRNIRPFQQESQLWHTSCRGLTPALSPTFHSSPTFAPFLTTTPAPS